MKFKYLFLFLSALSISGYLSSRESALTFEPGQDRFGDQAMTYIRAKKLSQKYGLPFFVPRFMYSDQLALSTHEYMYHQKEDLLFSHQAVLKKAPQSLRYKLNTLFIVPFDIEVPEWRSFDDMYYECINDQQFIHELKQMIKPIEPIETIHFPENIYATIAVHVRKGGGFDPPLLTETDTLHKNYSKIYADKIWPTKFPPDEFYIEQIRYISSLLSDRPLYVHIFTDDKNPQSITEKYKSVLNKKNIIYGCRNENNQFDMHVIEDLIHMAQFDYLIRPQSSYSRVAQLIGDHRLILSPAHAYWKRGKLIIDKISKVGPHA